MNHNAPPVTTPCLCIRLRRAAQRVTGLYDRLLEPAGITLNQYSLLANLNRMEGCAAGELAARIRLEKSTLARTLRPLFQAGYVTDAATPGSRRQRLHLTPAGKDVLNQAVPLWQQAQAAVKTRLGQRQAELLELLDRLDQDDHGTTPHNRQKA